MAIENNAQNSDRASLAMSPGGAIYACFPHVDTLSSRTLHYPPLSFFLSPSLSLHLSLPQSSYALPRYPSLLCGVCICEYVDGMCVWVSRIGRRPFDLVGEAPAGDPHVGLVARTDSLPHHRGYVCACVYMRALVTNTKQQHRRTEKKRQQITHQPDYASAAETKPLR